MAFVPSTPLRSFAAGTPWRRAASPVLRTSAVPTRATATGPQAPKDFVVPTPRVAFVRSDKAFDIATSSVGTILRAGAGALVEGYRIKPQDGKLVEYSATLPVTKPTQPLRFFEFEACPFCRKVRDAVSMLDLDVLMFPCPKNGMVYREYVKAKGGKAMFPYMEDPNTGFEGYESDDIIRYLYKTYGPASGVVPLVLGSASTVSAGLASSVRRGKGASRADRVVPAKKPVELYGYEASPFVKLVRETLCELELPYYLHTAARGSPTRAELKALAGQFQVPYIKDPNTGVAMFESAEICEYLMSTYGPSAPGAVSQPEEGSMFMPGDDMGETTDEKVSVVGSKSLDPKPSKDAALEKYCEDNPESDECRVYED